MPKTDEKLADILAEMRKAVVPMICGRPKIEAVSIRDVLQWADRIEAAAKREISEAQDGAASQAALDRMAKDAMEYYAQALKQKRPSPGNASAMRKALEQIVGWCEGCHADACEKVCRPGLTSESIHAALAARVRASSRVRRSREGAACQRHHQGD